MIAASKPVSLRRFTFFRTVLIVAIAAMLPLLHGAAPRALPEGELPKDSRLGALQDLNGYFPFVPPKSIAEGGRRMRQSRCVQLARRAAWCCTMT